MLVHMPRRSNPFQSFLVLLFLLQKLSLISLFFVLFFQSLCILYVIRGVEGDFIF